MQTLYCPDNIIKEFKARIEKIYGKRLKKVLLYGSWARNKATKDSDIDLVSILEGKIQAGKKIDRMIDILTDFLPTTNNPLKS